MAVIVDHESAYEGERQVRNSIEKHFSNDVIVYNNREVNGREYDLCLLVKDICVFIIEVKGWFSNKIKVNGVDNIIVEGYSEPQKSPKKQAKSYCIQYLTKLKKRFNTSPLVVDLVAYPFITKEEYYNTYLNIISEEQFTIFKEDLLSKNALQGKLQAAFDAKRAIPHAVLSQDIINRIRKEEEPNFVEECGSDLLQYSFTGIFTEEITSEEINKIIASYFEGTKQVVFIEKRKSFVTLLIALNDTYRRENIEPGSNLEVGYKDGIEDIQYLDSYHGFNFEAYFVEGISTVCDTNVYIDEGEWSLHEDILNWLAQHTSFNFQQYKVEHASSEKNILVEAGAGTGKTYSMVSRVAYLCNKRIGNIIDLEAELAMVTFTNDAAINMKVRLKRMFVNYYVLTGDPRFLGYVEGVERANISTIHKFSLQLLRGASFYTGLGTNFKISSDEYNRNKIYDVYLSAFLRAKEEENPSFIAQIPVPIYDLKKKIIGIADTLFQKSVYLNGIKPEEMGITVDNTLPYFNELIQHVIIPAETEYLSTINDKNAIDLKESIILLNKVLEMSAENISSLKIRYLFVDEFQDTDDVQIEVFQRIQRLINEDCRLFVVGDLKQSIYRFRGAKLSAFEQLKTCKKYGWENYYLNINYRTDYRLLDRYDAIFSRMGIEGYLPYNRENDRLSSRVIFNTDDTEVLQCIPCHGKDEKAFFEALFNCLEVQFRKTLALIESARRDGRRLNRSSRTIAILVRSNWQVAEIVREAQNRDISVEIKSGGDLFQLDSTLDLYKLALVLVNPTNPVYLVNFIESNYTDLKLDYQQLYNLSNKEKLKSIQNVLDSFFESRMGTTWEGVLEEVYSQPILYALKRIFDALKPWLQFSNKNSEQEFYISNYEYLLERIVKFYRVDALTLTQISKYLEINIVTRQKELSRNMETNDEGVHILCTTVHKSKGLEYGTVLLPYMNEDIGNIRKIKLDASYSQSKLAYTVTFENKIRERNSNYNEDIERTEQISEESRILYVALTRAIRNCIWLNNIDSASQISWSTLMEE